MSETIVPDTYGLDDFYYIRPQVYKPLKAADTKLHVRIPRGNQISSPRSFLREVIGAGRQIDHEGHNSWLVAQKYLGPVVDALVTAFGFCVIIRDTVSQTLCTGACQKAKSSPLLCECICGGRFHGDGFAGGWTFIEGDLLAGNPHYSRLVQIAGVFPSPDTESKSNVYV
jgi:hypothetical protein